MAVGGVGGDSSGEVVVKKENWLLAQLAAGWVHWAVQFKMAAVCGRGKVGKSGEVELDSVVLAEVYADGGGEAVGVADRVEVGLVVEESREVVSWTDLI